MKVFLIDAYDSFVFIISQYLEQLGLETRVERHDVPDLINRIEAFAPDFCVLGPGPGHPADVGYIELIRHFEGRLPILGVCLGHQALGLAYGAQVCRAPHVMHGKVSEVTNDGRGVYAHTGGRSIRATRYHSLMISDQALPGCLEVTSRSAGDDYIMGVRHRELPVEGVQFHPESILTENGLDLFRSFIRQYVQ
ncbi:MULTISPECIES: aminodeoxychorismate/anthranilate synthase component II [unclassified Pseudomonas]|uniref:anthranilate synthase component II n=1 Tax=unclassified Pseudomonas TaxID=196821 RepID=UPI000BC503DA|nr:MULTISPECIES: aminodeoxychorismate/anthranilate synthase component II [unclassified Pseudomonas]PVZ20400.1 anthranilate synthase component 2 [Pseudomonas sp. URIL14HWK12:I12]PVZ27466.1 anthranilate synthase component 2 [Pseudomonas sp. URIL14HWK12:I10]PVZ38355.1 anthranilate synthase component 2 [Pseudomonas sp. URIL14HWK12:I11]SNZ03687.1 anthranilate synthase component 2 [Pseudomonas sp. URIL14HWK12:I9]